MVLATYLMQKNWEKTGKIEIFTKKNVFDAQNFMSIFSQNLEYLSLRILNRSPQI